MSIPLQITFRDMDHSDALEAYVRRHCEKMEQLAPRATHCHVTIAMPHRHRQTARPVRISVDLRIPGQEIAVSHPRDEDTMTIDARAAVDEVFDQVARRIQDFLRNQRGDVKTHEATYQEAHVSKLWTYEGYGFLTTAEDGDVYFHKNSVLHHAFGKLKIGSKVRFIEEQGDKGPQASTVVVMD